MDMTIKIEVKRSIPEDAYTKLFATQADLAADMELFKQETIDDMKELYPQADEINVSIEAVNVPGNEEEAG